MHPQRSFDKPQAAYRPHDYQDCASANLIPDKPAPDERQARAATLRAPTKQNSPILDGLPGDTVRTFKQRDRWSRLIARDRRVKLMHHKVLLSLALCARTDSGGKLVIDPTHAELAKAADCSERTVYRAIDSAEENGIVRKARHSDGRVSNAYELLLQTANGCKSAEKAAEKTLPIQCPTLPNFAVAESSNPATAGRVLRAKRKEEVSKKESESAERDLTTLNDRPIPEPRAREPLAPVPRAVDAPPNPAFTTADDAPIPEPLIPVPRAEARTEPVAEQKQPPPCRASENIGTSPNANPAFAHAGPASMRSAEAPAEYSEPRATLSPPACSPPMATTLRTRWTRSPAPQMRLIR